MAQFVVVLDFSIVQIALPTIRDQLHVSVPLSTWVISAYGITFAGLLIFSGRAGDIYGRKKLFIAGLVLFGAASLAGGLAPSFTVLMAARAVQGVGAAICSANALSLIVQLFPEGGKRNSALSIFTGASAAAFGSGILLGGVLTSFFGWRAVMFVNVPIAIASAVISVRYIEQGKGEKAKKLDIPGAVLVTGGLMTLVYALTVSQSTSLLSLDVLAPLGLSGLILGGFFLVESRTEEPLTPIEFLSRRNIFSANVVAMVTPAGVSGMVFILALFLQQIQKLPPIIAGAAFVPSAIATFIMGGLLAARLIKRGGVKLVMAASLVVQAAGLLILSQLPSQGSYLEIMLIGMTVASIGSGSAFSSFRIAATAGTSKGEEGIASGLVNTSQQMGGPVGLAILLTIAAMFAHNLASGQLSPSDVIGFHYAFVGGAVLSAIGVAATLVMKPEEKRKKKEKE